ncbi:hypothetical protein P5V15_012189 [Pogonomyrmex californicus]
MKRHRRCTRVSSEKEETKVDIEKRFVNTEDRYKSLIIGILNSQDIKLARLLSNNDKKIRDKALKRLKKWLTIRSQSSFEFTKRDIMNLWRGLFYCMWMSDKMLIQEELAESISKLVHCFKSKDFIVLYTNCALETLATEWFGIDQYRLDKFSMLVRRILRQTFIACKNQLWNMEWVVEISQIFTQLFLHPKTGGLGFNLHLTEIYLEELAKVSDGNLLEDVVHEFVKPFAIYLITTSDERQMKHIMRYVFRYLIFQSDIGLDYMEKFKAWRDAGFPCAHIDDMQKIEISDTENNSNSEDKQFSETKTQSKIERPLDPRAGRVDVELPQIPFNAAKIAELLSSYKFHPSSTAKSRRQLLRLLNEFTVLSKGQMPLGIKTVRKRNFQKGDMDSKKAALRLIQFENNLFSDKINKKRKKKNEKDVRNQFSNSKNNDSLDVDPDVHSIGVTDSENKLTNTTAITRTDLQDVDINTVPFKKRKINDSKCDIPSNKSEIAKNKKKRMETSKKGDKTTKINLNQNSKKMLNENLKRKTKRLIIPKVQISENADQSISSISKKINKSLTKKAMSKTKSITQEMSSKNKLSKRSKKHTHSENSSEKKKVIFGLSRNTAQHKSDYLQQVRKSPGIPFDANKKPLASALKMNLIPSPINPFYKK